MKSILHISCQNLISGVNVLDFSLLCANLANPNTKDSDDFFKTSTFYKRWNSIFKLIKNICYFCYRSDQIFRKLDNTDLNTTFKASRN